VVGFTLVLVRQFSDVEPDYAPEITAPRSALVRAEHFDGAARSQIGTAALAGNRQGTRRWPTFHVSTTTANPFRTT
jgi:hypothetical protein